LNKVSNPKFWNDRYLDENTKWDLGGPTPILSHYLKTKNNIGRVCVLGCGKGHDAIEFSKYQNDVHAVDFSEEALKDLKQRASNENAKINIHNKDIFLLPNSHEDFFDMVYEYTCYCAIDPDRRADYFSMVHSILKKNGLFFGIMIPLDKDVYNDEGPPFGVSIKQIEELTASYFDIVENQFSKYSIEPRKGREKILVLKKK
tara:strand:+ start:535 stop:1140 length:606 start_codon:yes stop_codon:yes gene_type:complete